MTHHIQPVPDLHLQPCHVKMENQHSEVARMKAAIETEYQAGRQALYGLAVTARHDFINARSDRIAQQVTTLGSLIGDEAAMQFFIAVQDKYVGQTNTP